MVSVEPGIHDCEVYMDVLLRVIVTMMLADGEIADREVTTIVDVYHQKTAVRLDEDTIDDVIESVLEDTEDNFVQAVSSSMSGWQKAEILRGGVAVAMADDDFGDNEAAYLLMVAGQLGISRAEFSAILEEIVPQARVTA
jgi:uncharacterized tellurite resistance protein B-like protein